MMADDRFETAAGGRANDPSPAEELCWVRDLYDVTDAPENWRRFLARGCKLLDASVAAIAVRDSSNDANHLVAFHVHGCAEVLQCGGLRPKRADHNEPSLEILPSITTDRLASKPVFSVKIEMEDDQCVFKQLGVRHLLVARSVSDREEFSFLTVGRTANQPAFGPSDISLLETLLPHLQCAVQLADKLDQLRASVRASARVLDLMTVGVVIFDERGKRAIENEAARRIFTGDRAILRAITSELAKVRDSSRKKDDQGQDAHIVRLPARDGGQPLFAIIWRYPDDSLERRHDLAFIVDPAQEHNVCIDQAALQKLYGLTSTEARVAALLAKGNSVAEIAVHLGNTAHTVRTHLRHIFDKTGTARQIDLVHLLLRSLIALQMPFMTEHRNGL